MIANEGTAEAMMKELERGFTGQLLAPRDPGYDDARKVYNAMIDRQPARPIDGAAHDVGQTETAFSYRDANWAQVIVGVDPDPANADAIRQWTVDYWDATHPYSAGGAYINFLMHEGQDRVQASYRDNYRRLTEIKAAYDRDNVFHINQNIAPQA
jgi:hypothetical protein